MKIWVAQKRCKGRTKGKFKKCVRNLMKRGRHSRRSRR